MNKKRSFAKYVVALLCAMALPIWAQTNAGGEASNPAVVESSISTNDNVSQSNADVPGVSVKNTGPTHGAPGADVSDVIVGHAVGQRWAGLVGVLVPITGIIAVFGMPVAVVAIAFYAINRRHKMINETLRAMIEKGMPITPELVDSLKRRDPRHSKQSSADTPPVGAQSPEQPESVRIDMSGIHVGGKSPVDLSWGDSTHANRLRHLFPGLILAGVGAAFLISRGLHSAGGWIVFFIGAAFLIVWLVERLDQNGRPPSEPEK